MESDNVEIVAVCDCDRKKLDNAEKIYPELDDKKLARIFDDEFPYLVTPVAYDVELVPTVAARAMPGGVVECNTDDDCNLGCNRCHEGKCVRDCSGIYCDLDQFKVEDLSNYPWIDFSYEVYGTGPAMMPYEYRALFVNYSVVEGERWSLTEGPSGPACLDDEDEEALVWTPIRCFLRRLNISWW